MVADYRAGVTDGERAEYEEWFGVRTQNLKTQEARDSDGVSREDRKKEQEIVSPDSGLSDTSLATGSLRTADSDLLPTVSESSFPRRHIVSATLFWKHVNDGDPELPLPTRERMVDARRMGLVKRFDPWGSYVEPLVTHTRVAVEKHPDVTFRLYLAGDLDFLLPDFEGLGWEVRVMKSPSIRYCPGGFWRFLPLEEKDALVTVIDTDRMNEVSNEIQRTEAMEQMGLGLWRVPGYYNSDLSKQVRYRPILGGHFGARGGIPIRELIEAFIWHWRRGTLPQTANIPGLGERPIRFAKWPNYGFDEWFQLAAMYPWLAPGGTLTFIPSDARSLLLPADVDYAMWANPRSECVYF